MRCLWECSRLRIILFPFFKLQQSDPPSIFQSLSCYIFSLHLQLSIMRQINVKTPSGPASINYTISTPTSENASVIDPSLPTVLFLHPVYIGHIIFHRMLFFSTPFVHQRPPRNCISSPVRQSTREKV